jgi:hypothetical protein
MREKMDNITNIHKLIKRALEKAVQLKIDEQKNRDPKEVIAESIAEFNKYFAGVYKIDSFDFTKDMLEVSLSKNYDLGNSGDGELVHA